MKIKTAEVTGHALDWSVAKCERRPYSVILDAAKGALPLTAPIFSPSTDWAQGGPIIEREEIGTRRNAPCSDGRQWEAFGSITAKGAGYRWGYGPTPLIAAMRCFVASRLGDEVDVPDELMV